jgi:hypothetical protein
MFHHNAYASKWIGYMSGIFHSAHMHIHERGKWSFHRLHYEERDSINVDK